MTLWTRRSSVSAATASLAATQLRAAAPSQAKFIFVGSTAKGEGEGIHGGKWNPARGTISDLHLAFPCNQPRFMVACQSHGANLLFSGHQPKPDVAELSAFRIEASGELKVINTLRCLISRRA